MKGQSDLDFKGFRNITSNRKKTRLFIRHNTTTHKLQMKTALQS